MGLCASGDTQKSTSSYFHEDQEVEFKTEIYTPTASSLFNTLRKTSELVVLHPDSKADPLLPCTLSIDYDNAKSSTYKTLLNFKRLVLIGNFQRCKPTIIKQIKSYTNCARFNFVTEAYIASFLQEFPLFRASNWENNRIATSQVPIMVVDSKDIAEHSGSHFRVYIHSGSKRDMKIYNLIGISDERAIIAQTTEETNQKINKYYVTNLCNNTSKNIVLLHSPKIDSSLLSQIFTNFIKAKYSIPAPYVNIYLSKSLPKASPQMPTEAEEEHRKSTIDPSVKSPIDKFRDLFTKLQGDQGAQKTERAYNLLNTLVTNIYSHNENDEIYRKVRRTNKQINELLSKSKYGKRLLDELGFREQGDNWVNTVESKYLKIFKTDFDLGYKKYKTKDQSG